MTKQCTFGIIGGSGLYEMEALTEVEEIALQTPFGEPSDVYVTGRIGKTICAFLPRHGRGHRLAPHEINYRANVHGMRQLGVSHLLAISAVGSMREAIRPGDFIMVDQFIDRTWGRASTFFDEGVVAHVGYGDPVDSTLAGLAAAAARSAGVTVHPCGTYLCINGPQFSTRAESLLYRAWGVDVIGMTNATEAKLAREAQIAFATVALATDYDCWHEGEEDVDVAGVLATVAKNAQNARTLVAHLAESLPDPPPQSPAHRALDGAVMTAPEAMEEPGRSRTKLLRAPR